MKTKKKITGLICVCVALAVFTVSAIAAATNASGYQKLKALAFGTAFDDLGNATVEITTRVFRNGEELTSDSTLTMKDGDKNYELRWATYHAHYFGEFGTYSDSERVIQWYTPDNYYNEYSLEEYEEMMSYRGQDYGLVHTLGLDYFSPEIRQRFGEILLDAFVGGVKNNVVYDDGRISLKLSENQIPELVQLALAIFAESYGQNHGPFQYDNNVLIGADAGVKGLWVEAEIGPDGNSVDFSGILSIFSTVYGEPHAYDFGIDFKLSDVGTTVVSMPDLTGIDNMRVWSNAAKKMGLFQNEIIEYDDRGGIYGRHMDGTPVYEPFYAGLNDDGEITCIWDENGEVIYLCDPDGNRIYGWASRGVPIHEPIDGVAYDRNGYGEIVYYEE